MTDLPTEEQSLQILLQIRDQISAMEARFARGFDDMGDRLTALDTRLEALDCRLAALEGRMAGLRDRMESLEGRMDGLDARMDSLEVRMDGMEDRISALESRIEEMEATAGKYYEEQSKRTETAHSDLKRFAAIVNETILHYAGEMDRVRQRLDTIEKHHEFGPLPE